MVAKDLDFLWVFSLHNEGCQPTKQTTYESRRVSGPDGCIVRPSKWMCWCKGGRGGQTWPWQAVEDCYRER